MRRVPPEELRGEKGRLLGFSRVADTAQFAAAYVDRFVLASEDPDGTPAIASMSWSDFEGAVWNGDEHRLTLRFVDNARAPLTVRLEGKSGQSLALIIRERVEYSIVFQQQAQLPSGAVARGLVRRGPDETLFTEVIVDGPTIAQDEATIVRLEASLRDVTGLDAGA